MKDPRHRSNALLLVHFQNTITPQLSMLAAAQTKKGALQILVSKVFTVLAVVPHKRIAMLQVLAAAPQKF